MENLERRYISQEAAKPAEQEQEPVEEQVLFVSEQVRNNDVRIENLISQLPGDSHQEYEGRFSALRQDLQRTFQKIEVKLAYLTNRAFLPETKEKISLIRDMVPHFRPRAEVRRNVFGGPKEYGNDFEKIQSVDFSTLQKLADIIDFVTVDSQNFVNENYDFSVMPGFISHFNALKNQEIRGAIDKIGEERARVVDKKDLHASAFVPFIINFDEVENKRNLASFAEILQEYFSKSTRHDTTEKGVPTGGGGLDSKRLPRFLVENSQLELTDEKLDEFFREPISEERIGKFIQENHPWLESLNKMLGAQGQAEKQEFNLWINDLIPLVKESVNRGLISFDSRQDAEIILDYVKTFGMRNTPELFQVFVNLKRAKDVGEVDQKLKEQLQDELGIDIQKVCEKDPTNIGVVVKEILKRKAELLESLKDENVNLPDKLINSKLSADLFSFVKGASPSWKKKKGIEAILEVYKTTRSKNSEIFLPQDGYEKTSVEIPQISLGEIADQGSLKEKEKILANPDLALELSRQREAAYFFRKHQGDINRMSEELENTLLTALERQTETTKSDYGQMLLSEGRNEKAMIGMKGKLDGLESAHAQLRVLIGNKELNIHDVLKSYQSIIPDKLAEKRETIAKLSLALFNEIMPGPTFAFLDSASAESDEDFTKRSSAFLSYEIREHILNRKHDQDIAGQLDPEVTKAVKRAWGLTDKNIVIESGQKLNSLIEGKRTGKTRDVTFIPSRGLQKIFAGNIGNSCIDSQEEDFARGKFENITSYSLVLDEGKSTERFVGNFLLIETETEDGKPILVIRANNPSENLFSMLDGSVLIEKIIEHVRGVAKKRNIERVAVPLTDVSRASSNREAVAQYYKTNFEQNSKVGLINNADTNFNSYPIWDKNSTSAVVLI